jgi:predicted nucleic acid-binding protein
VIGFLDRSDIFHAAADAEIRELLGQGENLCVSVVTYAEILTAAKLAHREEGVVRGFFAELISAIVPVDERVAERAAELRSERRSLKMPDALILATAVLGDGVDRILCADDIGERIEELLGCEVVRLAPAG